MANTENLAENKTIIDALKNNGYEYDADSWHIEFHKRGKKVLWLMRGVREGVYELIEAGFHLFGKGKVSVYGNPNTLYKNISFEWALQEANRLSE